MVFVGIIAALALTSVLFVLYPLWRRGTSEAVPIGDGQQELLMEQRKAAYDAMIELDFDHELGKLDESDYRSLYERYRRQAVAALKAAREREAVLSAQIDRQVQQARLAPGFAVGPVAYAAPTSAINARERFAYSIERRPKVWMSALSVLFVVFAAGTLWVWSQGSRASANAQPVGVIAGDAHAALLIDNATGAWALSGDATGIRRSTDAGATWTATPVLPGQAAALAQDAGGGRVYALVAGRLSTSADGGVTWTVGGTIPRNVRFASLTADPEQAGRLLALDQFGALFESSDAGASWERTGFRPAGPVGSLTVAVPQPLELFAAAPEVGVVSGAANRWASANGVVNGALPTDVVHAVVYDRSTGSTAQMPDGSTVEGTAYVATDLGVFRSTDYGQDWFLLGPEREMLTVAVGPPGSKLLLAVSSAGEVFRSTDRGITWTGS
ncbi:MAG: exo-alpha-sialidase [Chloroflexia bacterium]|nr:exo-alpha-sialidase [Chloroflexia bacterium]